MSCRTLIMATALAALGVPALAAEDPAAAVRDVFAAHEAAVNGQDLDALMALYAPGEQTIMMGTGPEERWVGATAIAEAWGKIFEDFDAGSVKRDCPDVQGAIRGDLGWLSATCSYQDSLDGKVRSFPLNVTAVLSQVGGVWKLQTLHVSNPTAP